MTLRCVVFTPKIAVPEHIDKQPIYEIFSLILIPNKSSYNVSANHIESGTILGNSIITLRFGIPEQRLLKNHISSARRQKDLSDYCFKYTDRPFCLRTDDIYT